MYDASKISQIAKEELSESDALAVDWELKHSQVNRALTLMASRLSSAEGNKYPASFTKTWEKLTERVLVAA